MKKNPEKANLGMCHIGDMCQNGGYVPKWEMFRIGKVPIREVSITGCADRGMYSINLNFFYLKISPIEEFGGIFKHHKTF